MKRKIDAFDYAGHICKSLKQGVLLTTKSGETVNTMTIGWGMLGIEWNKPVFIAYVRESRYTKQLLDENGAFTVNIPMDTCDKNTLRFCGTKSGRDIDKIAQMGLHLVDPTTINVPGIAEFPLTLECKVIYQQAQNPEILPDAVIQRFYPAESDTHCRDAHTAYYGEIVDAYLIET